MREREREEFFSNFFIFHPYFIQHCCEITPPLIQIFQTLPLKNFFSYFSNSIVCPFGKVLLPLFVLAGTVLKSCQYDTNTCFIICYICSMITDFNDLPFVNVLLLVCNSGICIVEDSTFFKDIGIEVQNFVSSTTGMLQRRNFFFTAKIFQIFNLTYFQRFLKEFLTNPKLKYILFIEPSLIN